jgi:hypothetical protein
MASALQLLCFMTLLLATQAANAAECPPPPVGTAEHAVCVARSFVERSKPQWEVVLTAKEGGAVWLVEYSPKSSSVRGGAGLLEVAKPTGKVTLVRAER